MSGKGEYHSMMGDGSPSAAQSIVAGSFLATVRSVGPSVMRGARCCCPAVPDNDDTKNVIFISISSQYSRSVPTTGPVV